MTLTSQLADDTPGARRFRRFAPLAVLLGLMALTMTPASSPGSTTTTARARPMW